MEGYYDTEQFERCIKIKAYHTSVPDIRRAAEESKNLLSQDDDEPTVRASTVISILDEISNDPNIPIHARTLIWNVLSELESVRE